MSRTNPYKKKRRTAKGTLLIFGEGLAEEIFMKHLKGLYSFNSNVAVTIRKGRGGTAVNIVKDAANTPGSFNKKIVVLDNDKSNKEMLYARNEAKSKNIELVENTPCLEATLLAVLNKGKKYSHERSSWCKKEFESKYLDKKKRTEPNEYKKIFPKALLESGKSKVPVLKILITLMQGE